MSAVHIKGITSVLVNRSTKLFTLYVRCLIWIYHTTLGSKSIHLIYLLFKNLLSLEEMSLNTTDLPLRLSAALLMALMSLKQQVCWNNPWWWGVPLAEYWCTLQANLILSLPMWLWYSPVWFVRYTIRVGDGGWSCWSLGPYFFINFFSFHTCTNR